jgi:hypothetical protein
MKDCLFNKVTQGENSSEQSLARPSRIQINLGSTEVISWEKVIPPPQLSFLYPWWWFKKWLARLIVLPYLHEMVKAFIPLEYISRSFETYVIGYK